MRTNAIQLVWAIANCRTPVEETRINVPITRVKRKPAARLDNLDRLVKQMKAGRLDQRMKALVAERCESQETDDSGPDVI